MLNKKLLKAYTTVLLKTLNEPGIHFFIVSKRVEVLLIVMFILLRTTDLLLQS